MTKVCTSCKSLLAATPENFYRSPSGRFGLQAKCKVCYRDLCREARREGRWPSHRRGYARNREARLAATRLWFANNRERRRAYDRARYGSRPEFRMRKNIAEHLRATLRGKKGRRRWESVVGWLLADLMAHLERQFQPGMTWDNYGEWHVDHIRPIASFDFTRNWDAAVLECWSLTNLQPLWATENRRKSSRWPPPLAVA